MLIKCLSKSSAGAVALLSLAQAFFSAPTYSLLFTGPSPPGALRRLSRIPDTKARSRKLKDFLNLKPELNLDSPGLMASVIRPE